MYFECGPIEFSIGDGRRLLDGIRLTLSPPTLCILKGPSGTGKSTLLKAISGLNPARVEKRILEGREYTSGELAQWRSHVTLLPQDAPCLQGSVEKNLSFPFYLKNSKGKKFPRDEARFFLERLGLGHIELGQDIRGLSGGERHRVALIRGLLWSPPVLMADEPFGGLEQPLVLKCFEILREFSRKRPAVVIAVVHNEGLEGLADVVLRLKNGALHRA